MKEIELIKNKNFRNNQNYIISNKIKFKVFFLGKKYKTLYLHNFINYLIDIKLYKIILYLLITVFFIIYPRVLLTLLSFGSFYFLILIGYVIYIEELKNKVKYWYIFRNKINNNLIKKDFIFISKIKLNKINNEK